MGPLKMTQKEIEKELLIDIAAVPKGHLQLHEPEAGELEYEGKTTVDTTDVFWLNRCIIDLPPEFQNRTFVHSSEVSLKY